jgi:competence protein ComEA
MNFRFWIHPAALALALWAPLLGPAQSSLSKAPLDINRASAEQLADLPGIGPGRAAQIVRIRERNGPFRTIDELRMLPRLSEKQFQRLRDFVTVSLAPDPDSQSSHAGAASNPGPH